jgi:hypothetical protein
VVEALERLAAQPAGAATAAELARFFDDLGIDAYVFYSRCGADAFAATASRTSGPVAPRLDLSDGLRDFLASRPTFVDLTHLAFEWRYFFHQFELARLARASGGRYLLPVCLGPSLRGLLLLPDGEAQERVSRDALAAQVSSLALEAVRREGLPAPTA